MIKEKVCYIEMKCDRCGRSYKLEGATEVPDKGDDAVYASVYGEELTYTDLCDTCQSRVKNLFEDLKPITYGRGRSKKKENGETKAETKTEEPVTDPLEAPSII